MSSGSKKLKLVLDTNIYISGFVFPGSPPEELLRLALNKEIDVFASPYILQEVRRILGEKFAYTPGQTQSFIKKISRLAVPIKPAEKLLIIKAKKDDNRVLECALAAKADFLITGDKKHLLPLDKIGNTKIIDPRNFLDIYYSEYDSA